MGAAPPGSAWAHVRSAWEPAQHLRALWPPTARRQGGGRNRLVRSAAAALAVRSAAAAGCRGVIPLVLLAKQVISGANAPRPLARCKLQLSAALPPTFAPAPAPPLAPPAGCVGWRARSGPAVGAWIPHRWLARPQAQPRMQARIVIDRCGRPGGLPHAAAAPNPQPHLQPQPPISLQSSSPACAASMWRAPAAPGCPASPASSPQTRGWPIGARSPRPTATQVDGPGRNNCGTHA